MRITLSISKEHASVWDRARRQAWETRMSLSALVAMALDAYVGEELTPAKQKAIAEAVRALRREWGRDVRR